jgi:drug/metabolite transporter (DMT)-like permease
VRLSPETKAVLALVVASFLFGATFVIVKSAIESIGPISFVAWRFVLGAAILLLIGVPRGWSIWRDGSIAGVALFAGYALQTGGLALTTASNSALITGLFVVLTPFLAAAFHRYRPSPWSVGAAVVAFLGLFLVTGADGLRLGGGDILTLGCALAFAVHVVALSIYAPKHPVISFTAVQLAVVAVGSIPLAVVLDGFAWPDRSVWPAILITGIAVSVGAYVLQAWAQTVVGAATAAVVLAAEPAFGVATAWVVLGESLDPAGWLGAGMIVVAIVVVIKRQKDPASIQAEAVTPAH